jgi:hypothetical protein
MAARSGSQLEVCRRQRQPVGRNSDPRRQSGTVNHRDKQVLRNTGIRAQAGRAGEIDAFPLQASLIAGPGEILQHAREGGPGCLSLSLK